MQINHRSWTEINECQPEKNSGEKKLIEELSMTVKEAVATLAIRGDILTARRAATGSFSLDKEKALSMIENAETNPQYIDVIERMKRRRAAIEQIEKINKYKLEKEETKEVTIL